MICLTKPTPARHSPSNFSIGHRGGRGSSTSPPPCLHLLPPTRISKQPGTRSFHCCSRSHAYELPSLPRRTTRRDAAAIPAAATGVGRHADGQQMWALCGFGYWVQGFRCFPWLALNFHLVHALHLSPSSLQLVQHTGCLPMVAKPLFGVLSDAVHIGGARRLPYIAIGAFLQLMSWGTLALFATTGQIFSMQMACILISNLGASVTEVVSDALVAEIGRTHREGELQSYAFIALAVGALLGNLSGGFLLLKTQEPKTMFFTFSFLLAMQLALSLTTREEEIYSLPNPSSKYQIIRGTVSENLGEKFSNLITAVSEESIFYPLSWIVASVAVVPILSGSMFCFQTQFLQLDPSVIGLSKVIGQLMVLCATVFYERCLKRIPMRRLIFGTQVLYALALLSDFFLVKRINVKLGISNEAYVLCFSALAEAFAQLKVLPFTVLFSQQCPAGCEGSLFAFFASAMCLSSILSGVFGVGLASLIGVAAGDYSSMHWGILLQFVAALVPLGWISCVPMTASSKEMRLAQR
ncbi:putative folate-biopterin transporter 9, chloroplastic [Canna indica]|uniref:Folate-biopterin transporter 9, chloroplastic n=1 Tax=Canna indica TaxID=4628 RepID=A0AAQ3KF69_9LILI|nr:putative folate-biopterin transporter 9, chloroplastic [Canna indica]